MADTKISAATAGTVAETSEIPANESGASKKYTLRQIVGLVLGWIGLANGQEFRIKSLTELTTIAAAAYTDTAMLIPAGALVLGVSTRVTVAIPTASTYIVGLPGSIGAFRYPGISTAAGTADAGVIGTPGATASAVAVRITPDLTPASNAGRVRVTVHYVEVTAPTS